MDKSIAHHKNHGVGMMILVIMFTVLASLSAGGGGGNFQSRMFKRGIRKQKMPREGKGG